MSANGNSYVYVDASGQLKRVSETNLNFRGPYSAVASYVFKDIADSGDDQYIALVSSTGSLPPTNLGRNAFWSGLALVKETKSCPLPEELTQPMTVFTNGTTGWFQSDSPKLDYTSGVSISCRVIVTNGSVSGTVFGRYDGLNGFRLEYDSAAKAFSFELRDALSFAIERAIHPTVVEQDRCYHVIVTCDNTHTHIWVDGVDMLDDAVTYTKASVNFKTEFLGKLTDFIFWQDRVLNNSEVATVFDSYAKA